MQLDQEVEEALTGEGIVCVTLKVPDMTLGQQVGHLIATLVLFAPLGSRLSQGYF